MRILGDDPDRTGSRIRVILIDDHALMRAGLRLLLSAEPDIEVAGEAADTTGGIELALTIKPDIALVDLTLPGAGGIAVIEAVRQGSPGTRAIALTMHDDVEYLRSVLAAGGQGFVVKEAADAELLTAIRTVREGRAFISMTLESPQQVFGRVLKPRDNAGGPELSRREQQVLILIARGCTNQEAADELGLGVKTVETYRTRLAEKLGMRTRAELVRYAVERGLTEDSPPAR